MKRNCELDPARQPASVWSQNDLSRYLLHPEVLSDGTWVARSPRTRFRSRGDRFRGTRTGEFVAAVHRHLREGRLTPNEMDGVLQVFDKDCDEGYWQWLPMTDAVMNVARATFRTLPNDVFLRSGDALHLACAQHYGFSDVFSSDRHLLHAATAFGITAKDRRINKCRSDGLSWPSRPGQERPGLHFNSRQLLMRRS